MAKASTKILTANFIFRNETKGALRFEEVDANGNATVELMGGLYLRKSGTAGLKPKGLKVTIEVIE